MIGEAFLTALAAFTRVRLHTTPPEPEAAGYSTLFYPVVGFIIGGVLVLLMLALPSGGLLLAGLILAARVALAAPGNYLGYGRALGAWLTPATERAGPHAAMNQTLIGALALALALILQFAALIDVLSVGAYTAILVIPMLSLGLVGALYFSTPYVGGDGPGADIARQLPRLELARVLLLALIAGAVIGRLRLAAAAVLVFFVLRWFLRRRVGGMTEDAAGAAVIVAETALLVAAAF